MLSGWFIIIISLLYVCLLFGIAYYGDKTERGKRYASHPAVYALSLAVYCSSWTFYGAVGRATDTGWEFIATYLGPAIIFIFGWRLMEKMVLISKQQNITTIADFLSSRYGKSRSIAVLVTVIAVCGTIPYIAMQLKAVAISYDALAPGTTEALSKGSDTALFVALLMAVFTILFGVRHIDATEHHQGIVLAVAFESIIKLTAFLAVGFFVTFNLFGGAMETLSVVSQQLTRSHYGSLFEGSVITEVLLACAAIICLPRQFHVTIVESTRHDNLRTARWLFPGYLLLLSLFVLPISAAGFGAFEGDGVIADLFVLLIPLQHDQQLLATFAFIGGLSAATSMVIVASITLATMVCNDILMPFLFWLSRDKLTRKHDLGRLLLTVRRITIVSLLLLSYFYYRSFGHLGNLASFGLLAFVAAAQFLPAILGGIYWKRGSRKGAIAGLIAGFSLWLYTLVFPSFVDASIISAQALPEASWYYNWLHPTALFGLSSLDPLTHGALWSIGVNALLYFLVSNYTSQRVVEKIQASAFADVYDKEGIEDSRYDSQVTVGDLKILTERFLGLRRTQQAFTDYAQQRHLEPPLAGDKATQEQIIFTERLLSGVIGASSARIVLASVLQGRDMQIGDVVSIVDEASQALRFNRSLLQSTIENIDQGISVVDQQLRLVAWNRRYLEIFDFPKGMICVGRSMEEIYRHLAIKGEYGQGVIDQLVAKKVRDLRSGKPSITERYRPDDSVLQVRGNPMPNGGYVNTYTDITEHKQIEAALKQSEQNIRIYTDRVPVLIAYLNVERCYQFVNKAYADAFDIDRHNIQGTHCQDVLTHAQYLEREPYMLGVLAGERQRFETTIPSKDRYRFAEVTYMPHQDGEGLLLGYFTLYLDITERRAAERALQITNETLEQRVKERTQALSVVNRELRKENTVRALIEDELRQASRQADAANLGKTRFLAAASHDLLQPLNAARLFTSALRQKDHQEGDTRQLIENLDGSLKAAEELITAILDISKLDAGALEPSFSHFSIRGLFDNLSTEFDALAREKQLSFHCQGSDLVVLSDRTLLRRVLQNFLSNAVRYTQQGKILLGCRRQPNYLRIEVWDTGVGIAEEKQHEVFEEFKRIDNPKHSQVTGLGLGLAITERISRMLGHQIDVRSWPGRGTVFSITVPLGDSDKAVKAKPEQRGWIRSKALNGTRVLVIDNEPKILEGMSALLNGWGCETQTALNSESALAICADSQPDLVIADYHLSETDTGLQALESLYQHWQQAVPAVVITADRTQEVQQEIAEFGAQLLTKPVKPAGLRAMINKLVVQSH